MLVICFVGRHLEENALRNRFVPMCPASAKTVSIRTYQLARPRAKRINSASEIHVVAISASRNLDVVGPNAITLPLFASDIAERRYSPTPKALRRR
jgi:hypothetical protein